ncbi:MAG: hypothetical protein M3128_11370, partial [Verrucomicrobiota bacterium]|nr:hypothetical protein [Verrucomicrobiota bacterium]
MHFNSSPAARRLPAILIFALAALPAIYLWWQVARLGVEIPRMDDWEIGRAIVKAHTHQLTWQELFKQENEARMVVPKLLFIASTMSGRWDVRQQMELSLVVCAATALGIYLLLHRSKLSPMSCAICFLLIVLLIFSPAQYELWLFASGLPSFMPIFFILAALLLYETRISVGAKFASSVVLAFMCSFTLPQGLLAWGLTFPFYLLGYKPVAWKRWAGAWLFATALCAAIYFYDYRRPAHLPPFAPAVSLWRYLHFFLAFLGNSLAYADRDHPLRLSFLVGALFLFLFAGAMVYSLRSRKREEFVRRVLPFFALGFYSLGSAFLATLGRVGFGGDGAIASRYITFSLYLLVAVIALLAIIGSDLNQGRASRSLPIGFVPACAILIGASLGLYQACFRYSLTKLEIVSLHSRISRSAILFSRVLDTSALIQKVNYPHPPTVIARAAILDNLHLLQPALIRSAEISSLSHQEADGRSVSGWCETITPVEGDSFLVAGWAALNR